MKYSAAHHIPILYSRHILCPWLAIGGLPNPELLTSVVSFRVCRIVALVQPGTRSNLTLVARRMAILSLQNQGLRSVRAAFF